MAELIFINLNNTKRPIIWAYGKGMLCIRPKKLKDNFYSIVIPLEELKSLSNEQIGEYVNEVKNHIAEERIRDFAYFEEIDSYSIETIQELISFFKNFKENDNYASIIKILFNAKRNKLKEKRNKEIEFKKNRQGIIYIVEDKENYKIGVTKDIVKRFSGLQTSNPRTLKLIFFEKINSYKEVEKIIHKKYSKFKIKREWFKLDKNQILEIQYFIKKHK